MSLSTPPENYVSHYQIAARARGRAAALAATAAERKRSGGYRMKTLSVYQ